MTASDGVSSEHETLRAVLRAIRRRRGLGPRDVALAMGLPLRTYQHFEAGPSQFNLDRIKAFAKATDSDPYAILAAMMIGSPAFAVRTIDNKLISVLVEGLRHFDERLGDAIARLEVGRLIAAFLKAFDDLEGELRAQDAQTRLWMDGAADAPPTTDEPPED